MFLGLPDPDPLVRDMDPEPALQVLLDGAVQGEAHLLQQEVYLHAHKLQQPVLRIRILTIHMFLGLNMMRIQKHRCRGTCH